MLPMQLKTLILPVLLSLPLAGCGLVYKVDIPQGNYIEEKQVAQLRQGMTKEQVQFLLGNPMSLDGFNNDRWVYMYYFQPGRGDKEQKQLILEFVNDGLGTVSGDFPLPEAFYQGI